MQFSHRLDKKMLKIPARLLNDKPIKAMNSGYDDNDDEVFENWNDLVQQNSNQPSLTPLGSSPRFVKFVEVLASRRTPTHHLPTLSSAETLSKADRFRSHLRNLSSHGEHMFHDSTMAPVGSVYRVGKDNLGNTVVDRTTRQVTWRNYLTNLFNLKSDQMLPCYRQQVKLSHDAQEIGILFRGLQQIKEEIPEDDYDVYVTQKMQQTRSMRRTGIQFGFAKMSSSASSSRSVSSQGTISVQDRKQSSASSRSSSRND